jgi:hypothetical protein
VKKRVDGRLDDLTDELAPHVIHPIAQGQRAKEEALAAGPAKVQLPKRGAFEHDEHGESILVVRRGQKVFRIEIGPCLKSRFETFSPEQLREHIQNGASLIVDPDEVHLSLMGPFACRATTRTGLLRRGQGSRSKDRDCDDGHRFKGERQSPRCVFLRTPHRHSKGNS